MRRARVSTTPVIVLAPWLKLFDGHELSHNSHDDDDDDDGESDAKTNLRCVLLRNSHEGLSGIQ